MSVMVIVWGSVGMLVVYRGLLKIVGFISRDVVKCKVCLCSGCDGCCDFCFSCDACSCKCWVECLFRHACVVC